jgi:phosphoenolpyruvate carboxykinase (ATP)
VQDPIFRFLIPTACPHVPDTLLQPRHTWQDQAAYDTTARQLARSFHEHFKPLSYGMDEAVLAAGPTAS